MSTSSPFFQNLMEHLDGKGEVEEEVEEEVSERIGGMEGWEERIRGV